MITIRFTGSDWTRIRFGISPLWETVAAVRASAGAGFGSGSDPGDRILRRLGQLDLPLLRRVVDPHRAYLPDFLAPPPDSADVSFAQELGGVVATSPALVQRELRLAGILTTRREAATTVERLAGELQAAWEWAVVPEWPAIRGVLEQDIAWRAREVTRGGAEGMLAGLHPSLTSDGFSLTIRTDRSATRTSAGAGLSLIPSVFAWPQLYVVDAAP